MKEEILTSVTNVTQAFHKCPSQKITFQGFMMEKIHASIAHCVVQALVEKET